MPSSSAKKTRATETVLAGLINAAPVDGREMLFGVSAKAPKLVEIRLENIRPNPNQPRRSFDEQGLEELAQSIARHGLLQPVTVKRAQGSDAYLLVAGERRFRAMEKLGRGTITAIVTDGNVDEIAIIENLQREDLHPVDQADALARLVETHSYTQEQVAQVIGKARSSVAELLQIARLPGVIKDEARAVEIAKSVLIEVARLGSAAAQVDAWRKIREDRTIRAVREVRSGGQGPTKPPRSTVGKAVAAAQSLAKALRELEKAYIPLEEAQRDQLVQTRSLLDAVLARQNERPY
jgi:ParB family chromosome partitioning protein